MANRSALAMSSTAALLLATSPGHAQEPVATADQWTILAAPYLWAAKLSGHAKVQGIKADVDVSFKDTLEDLNLAGMMIVEARKGKFGFAVNPVFVRTNADGGSGTLNTKTTTDIATAGFAAFYRVAEWQIGQTESGDPLTLAIEPAVGARLNYLRSEVQARIDTGPGNVRREVDEDQLWVDPLFGVNVIAQLTERWGLRAEADIGGFGVGSDLTWNAQALLTYRWSFAGYDVFAGAGYRALYWDYQDGGFEWDVTMQGPVIGGGIRF